jgi:nicotinamidase-related amidase
MNLKTHLVIIDPQNDFCRSDGALFVQGADKDMERLAGMINRCKEKLYDIHVTMDSHHLFHVAHPNAWVDSNGNNPAPFTMITSSDVISGKWRASCPAFQNKWLEYVQSLEKNGRYVLVIWPPHCLIGSEGHNIYKSVWDELTGWEKKFPGNIVDYITKGSNYSTEHYSAVQSDVPDPSDSSTSLDMSPSGIINTLAKADVIALAGEALDYCMANTITDIANNFGEDNIKKMVLLKDCTSSITPGGDKETAFLNDLTTRGMRVMNSTEFLA